MSSPVSDTAKSDEQPFELDHVWLRFRDPVIEQVFVRDTLVSSINFIRAYLIAGCTLYMCFGILDAVVGGHALPSMLAIRYGVVVPIISTVFVLTYFPIFYRVAQFALGMVMLSAGLGVAAMTAFMGPPFNSW